MLIPRAKNLMNSGYGRSPTYTLKKRIIVDKCVPTLGTVMRIEIITKIIGLVLAVSGLLLIFLPMVIPHVSLKEIIMTSWSILLLFIGLSLVVGLKIVRSIRSKEVKTPASIKDALKVLSFTSFLSVFPILATIPFFYKGVVEEADGFTLSITIDFGSIVGIFTLFLFPILLTILTVVYAKRVNGLSLSDLGLKRGHLWQNILLGFVVGGLLLSLGFALDPVLNAQLKPYLGDNVFSQLFREGVSRAPVVFFLLGGAVAPITEEVFFRGYAYPAFRNRFRVKGGLVLSSLLFVLLHLNPWDFVGITMAGIILAALFQKTGSLVSPMMAHAVNNVVIFSLLFLGLI